MMADGTNVNQEQYRKLQREIASSEQSLNKLEKESKNASKGIKDVGDKSKESSKHLDTLKNIAGGVASGMAAIGAAGAGVVTAIGTMALKAGQSADDINTLSAQTGLATDQIQMFKYASETIDVSLDTLTGSMAKLTKNMSTASKGSGDVYDAFNQLGVSFKNTDGTLRNNQDVFNECIHALGEMENETERDALAMKLFGKSAQDLNPLIKGGADTLAQMSKQAKQLGIILDQETLDKANAFNDQVDLLKANASGAFSALGSEIAGELVPYMEELNSVTMDAIGNLIQAFREDGLEGLVEGFASILSDILNKIIEYLPRVVDMGVQILQTLLGGIQNNLANITASVVQVISTLLTAFITMLPQIIQMGMTIIVELINGIAQQLPTLIPTIVECVLLIVQTLLDNIDLIIDAGINILMALIQGIIESLPMIIEQLPQIITKIIQVITDNLPKIIEAGITILVMLITGIIEAIPQLVEALPEIITAIVDGLMNGLTKIWEVGKNLVEGLWNGLLQAKDWLFNKVKEFAKGILDSIKAALGIASPSKVFRDEVGTNIALGVGEGFSKSMKSVASEMSDIMDDLSTTMTNEITIGDIPKTSPRITHENNYITRNYQNTTETIRQSSPVILQVNDKELGRVIVPIYDREKNRQGVSVAK